MKNYILLFVVLLIADVFFAFSEESVSAEAKTTNKDLSVTTPKNICLIYTGTTSRRQWNASDFIPYLIYEDAEKNIIPLFDTFLFIEYQTPEGKLFWGGQNEEKISHVRDWEWLADMWGNSLSQLNDAVRELHQKSILNKVINVIITIPEPSMEIKNFGDVKGRGTHLNFTNEEDRITAIRWYIEKILNHFSTNSYSHLKLLGFYWLGESIPEVMENTVKQTASLIHQANLLFFWIPYFTANNVWAWKDLGFDYMFYQPNYFFDGDGGVERLGLTAYRIEKYRCGAEMELDDRILTSENHRVRFLQYLQTAVNSGWDKKTIAWYQANDTIYKLARSDNEEQKNLYRDIVHFIKGTYQPPFHLPPIQKYKIPPREGKNWAYRDNGTKVIEPSSGFCFSLNPEWAIDGDVDSYSGTSGFACCSIPGEIKIQFAGSITISRIQMLLFNLDDRYYQYRVEISEDGQLWKTIVDKSYGEHRGWQIDTFPPQTACYLQIIPLFNSKGQNLFHLVELEVY